MRRPGSGYYRVDIGQSVGQLAPRQGLATVAKSQFLSAREGAIDAKDFRGPVFVQGVNCQFSGLSGSRHQDTSLRKVPQFLFEHGHGRMADGGASLAYLSFRPRPFPRVSGAGKKVGEQGA